MKAVGVWQVKRGNVAWIESASVRLERELEEWIERDPSLLDGGLEVVGRQIHVEGGIIDLLAIDLQGRWAVIEIKRGNLHRDAVAQALEYASCIAEMGFQELTGKVNDYLKSVGRENQEFEKTLRERIQSEGTDTKGREVVVYVVGTGQDPSLERILNFLGKSQRVVHAVLFSVFELDGGHRILVRELTSTDAASISPPPPLEEVLKVAGRNGLGEVFNSLVAAARRHDIYPRPFKHGIMFAPLTNKTRVLFFACVDPPADGMVKFGVSPRAFQQFYGLRKGLVAKALDAAGYRALPVTEVLKFAGALDRLMSSVGH
jgi:hypothetical protein